MIFNSKCNTICQTKSSAEGRGKQAVQF